jgi:TrkA-N domain
MRRSADATRSPIVVEIAELPGCVGTEEVAGRHDADEPAVALDEDVADVALHHLLGDIGDVGVGVAPHEVAMGDFRRCGVTHATMCGEGAHDVAFGHYALHVIALSYNKDADIGGGQCRSHGPQVGISIHAQNGICRQGRNRQRAHNRFAHGSNSGHSDRFPLGPPDRVGRDVRPWAARPAARSVDRPEFDVEGSGVVMPAPTLIRRSRHVLLGSAALAGVVVVGSVGYVVLGLGVLDAVYQTVTTITTVGPLNGAGQIFTIMLILAGVGTALYTLTMVLEMFVERHVGGAMERRRIDRAIGALGGHVIVCGWGRVGRAAADDLERAGMPMVVVDVDPERVAAIPRSYPRSAETRPMTTSSDTPGIDRAAAAITGLRTLGRRVPTPSRWGEC